MSAFAKAVCNTMYLLYSNFWGSEKKRKFKSYEKNENGSVDQDE